MAGRRVKHRRYPLLNDAVRSELVTRVRAGAPLHMAAQAVNISDRTLRNWMARGHDEEVRLDEIRDADESGTPPTPDPQERPYLDLWLQLRQARADAGVRSVALIQKSAVGGAIIEETTRTYRDSDGNKVTETTVRRAAPDWRASAFLLQHTHRDSFGKEATTVEIVTGTQGVTDDEDTPQSTIDKLAARIEENIAAALAADAALQITDGTERGGEEPIDAEIVED